MFKRILSLSLSIILIATIGLCLCSCKDSADDNFPVTIGNVTITEEPQNIVVLSSELADIISYMGYDRKMIGKSADCDHKYFNRIPSVGMKTSPDVKSIIALEADLVVADAAMPQSAKKQLADADITVVTLNNVTDIKNLKTLYVNIGTMLGGKVTGKAEAEKAYAKLFDSLSDFKDNIPSDIITTACYLYLDENGELCTFTKGSLEFSVFSYCGALNTFETQETAIIDHEQLKFGTPTFIFYDDPAVLEYLKNDPELCKMSAVVNEKTMQIRKSDFTHLGITFYDTIYKMIDFMFIPDKTESTPDELLASSTTDELEDVTQEDTFSAE